MSLYGKVKPLYLALPQSARRWILQRALHRAPRLSDGIVSWLERPAAPDELYDERYYDDIDPFMLVSAPAISRSIKREFDPQSVIDVGCGAGTGSRSSRRAGSPSTVICRRVYVQSGAMRALRGFSTDR